MEKRNELEARLQTIRTLLDEADGTPFGKVGALLDKMTTETDLAISAAKALREDAA